MIGPFGRQGPAATLRQHCPQLTRRRCTGSSKINGAKFSDACSVRANWLCMGWPFCLAEMRREFQTGGKLFCTTLYISIRASLFCHATIQSSVCNLAHASLETAVNTTLLDFRNPTASALDEVSVLVSLHSDKGLFKDGRRKWESKR